MDAGVHGSGGKTVRQKSSSGRSEPYKKESSKSAPPVDENVENKLYVGNLDHRVTEYHVIKMFNPHGKIKREEYLWHTHGPKKGEPRGYAFVEYSKRQEAERAQKAMNGKIAFGRPLVVRFVDEKVVTYNMDAPVWTKEPVDAAKPETSSASVVSKSAKIAAIQHKLRMMEREKDLLPQISNPVFNPSAGSSTSLNSHQPMFYPARTDQRNDGSSEGGHRLQSRTLLQSGQRWSSGWG